MGEARILGKTHTVLEYLKDAKRHIIGHDVYDIEDLYRRFTLLDFGSPGEVVMTGLALVEMASWDIIGKKANLPVYQLIGGKVHDRIPAYANGWYKGERTPELFAEAAQKVVERGYLGLKFDPFGNGNLELSRKEFHKSIELIEAVHSVTGDQVQMFIEMHGRFAPHQAVEIARDIEHFNPGWIEEPCRPEDVPALRYVMEHTCIPIATGRTSVPRAAVPRPAWQPPRAHHPAGPEPVRRTAGNQENLLHCRNRTPSWPRRTTSAA